MAKYKKNKDGYYSAYVPTGEYGANGVPEYKRFRAKTVTELEKRVAAFEKDRLDLVTASKTTLDEWFELWMASYKSGVRESTSSFYRTLYKSHISPVMGQRRVSDVRNLHCQSLLADMERTGLSHRTIKGVRGILSSLFEAARVNGMIAVTPAAALKAGGKEKEKRRALTKNERERYLAACGRDPFGLFGAFLYWFGLRRGEALALRGDDIKGSFIHIDKQHTFPDNNRPVVGPPKTKAGVRDVPIPDEARKYIDFDSLPAGLIFVNAKGEPLSHHEFRARWDHFIKAALGDGTEITAHYLRHNYATMLCEAGIPLLAAKSYCGHDNAQTTLDIYQHCSDTLRIKADDMMLSLGVQP